MLRFGGKTIYNNVFLSFYTIASIAGYYLDMIGYWRQIEMHK